MFKNIENIRKTGNDHLTRKMKKTGNVLKLETSTELGRTQN